MKKEAEETTTMQTTTRPEAPTRLLRRPQVEERVGLKRTQLYALIKEGKFPRPVKLTPGPRARAVAWVEAEIEAWLRERVEQSRAAA